MRAKHKAAEGAPTGGQVRVNLDHLSRSPSVTIVGARPIGATRHLVRNLTETGEPFGGQVNLVARHGFSLNGLPTIADISEVAGELGILWLLLNPDRSLNFLESLDREPRGAQPANLTRKSTHTARKPSRHVIFLPSSNSRPM